MKEILWLIKNTFKVTFKNKKNLLVYLGLPVAGILLAILAHSGSEETKIRIGVVNSDHSFAAEKTVDYLKTLQNAEVSEIKKEEIDEKITSGTEDAVIVLNKGFSKNLLAGNPVNVEITAIKGKEITSFLTSDLYEYLDVLSAFGKTSGGNQAAFEKMIHSHEQSPLKLSAAEIKDTSKSNMTVAGSIGYLILIMLVSAGNLSEIILKEKESRTYFRLQAAPIGSKKYVLSNIAVNLFLMAAQILITLFFLTAVFHISMGISFIEMFSVLMLFALVAVGLSLIFTAYASSSAAASAMQNLIISPTCLIGGCFFKTNIMPDVLQKAADFLPQKWVLKTITQLQEGHSLGSLGLNLLILFAFAAAFFLIAVYGFSRENRSGNFV